MTYSCLHTHTDFCDGGGSVDEFCRVAAEKGFVSLGLSAHAPLPPSSAVKSDWHLPAENLDAYIDAVRAAKEAWKGVLEVYLGLEVDYIRGFCGPADLYYQTLGVDYIIGSVHCVLPPGEQVGWAAERAKEKLLCVDGSREEFEYLLQQGFGGDAQRLVTAYYDDLIAMCRSGGFDILGHADLIVKNNAGGRFFSTDEPYYTRCIDRLAGALCESGIVVEVNTGGLIRKRTEAVYPAPAVLRALRRKGIPVTINADAHLPEHLGGHYEDARRALQEAGYTSFNLFSGGPDRITRWRPSPLEA